MSGSLQAWAPRCAGASACRDSAARLAQSRRATTSLAPQPRRQRRAAGTLLVEARAAKGAASRTKARQQLRALPL
jgi:hypothetical protein